MPGSDHQGRRSTRVWKVVVAAGLVGVLALGVTAVQLSRRVSSLEHRNNTLADQLTSADELAASRQEQTSKQLAALSADLTKQLATLGGEITAQKAQMTQLIDNAPPNWRSVARTVAASVVQVRCGGSLGSGFAVTVPGMPKAYRTAILTNAHVVQACAVGRFDEVTYVRSGQSRPAFLANADYQPSDNRDVALIYLSEQLPVLKPGPAPDQGAEVATMGFPLGLPSNFTTGVVSQVYASGWIQTNADISAGNSGGPLLDSAGRVLGITTMSIIYTEEDVPRPTQNLNFAEPLSNACDLLAAASACPFG